MQFALSKEYKRYTVCTLILLLSGLAFYQLALRLLTEISIRQVRTRMQDGHYTAALNSLEKAYRRQPGDYRLPHLLGTVAHKRATTVPLVWKAYPLAVRAKAHFLAASRLNPLDAQLAYDLSRVEAWLEKLFKFFRSGFGGRPYNALPYFNKALQLRPNSITFHYAHARYLHYRKKTSELLHSVRNMTRIYPQVYHHLKRERFWSPSVKAAAREGLAQAVSQKIDVVNAHKTLSALLAEDKNFTGSIFHYRKALELNPVKTTGGDYFHLGRLHLRSGDLEAAKDLFFKGLSNSGDRERRLDSLYPVFKHQGILDDLYLFYLAAQDRFPMSERIDLLLARTLIDLKQYTQARRMLENLNAKAPAANAYYLLARIAEAEKDWHAMELEIQKATVLAPRNTGYRRAFLNLLKRLNKLDSAEKEIDVIIQYADKPSDRHFNERAQLRWRQKKYPAAVDDWQTAIRLAPQNARYHASIAEAYIKIGKWSEAVGNYQKAVDLKPDNQNYRKRLLALKSEN